MKLKTSFFNFPLLKKNITRFAPLWAAYLGLWAVALLSLANEVLRGHGAVGDVPDAYLFAGNPAGMLYGLLLTMTLFSYLFNHRSISMMHSLPVKRSGIFATNYLTGALMIVVPNTIVILLTMIITAAVSPNVAAQLPGVWLAMNVMGLFYFTFAVFIAMFTGQILALPVFFVVYNFWFMVVSQFVGMFMEMLQSSGYAWHSFFSRDALGYLTPVFKFANLGYMDFRGQAAICAVYAVITVVLVILSYLVYRRRKSEWAGDIVTEPWARVVFRYGVALTSALVLGSIFAEAIFWRSDAVVERIVSMIVVGSVGMFVACALQNKTVRVGKQTLKGGIVSALVVLLIAGVGYTNFFGLTTRPLNLEHVHSISLYTETGAPVTLKERETMELVQQTHIRILENPKLYDEDSWDENSARIEFLYHMENGSTKCWRYNIPVTVKTLSDPESPAYALQTAMDTKEYRSSAKLEELYWEDTFSIESVHLEYETDKGQQQRWGFTPEESVLLYQALLEDAKADRMPRVELPAHDAMMNESAEVLTPDTEEVTVEEYTGETTQRPPVLIFYIEFPEKSGHGTYGTAMSTEVYVVLHPDMTATMEALKSIQIDGWVPTSVFESDEA